MSVFSSIPRDQWVASNELAFAIRDGYPVSEGHTLVIPKRVVASWFEASEAERSALLQLVDRVKADLDRELQPDAYNIGINDGAAAGQTVAHLHVHVIPRWHGDVDDPRGGVRYVIPERGNYKEPGRLPAAKRDPGPWPAVAEAFARLTRHIVDWRLATNRRRHAGREDTASSFTCKVSWNGRDPILFLPSDNRDTLPHGETDVRLETGEVWSFRFVKVAVNVARPVGQRTNGLPDLLREWFAPEVGKPGTDARVRFRRSPEGWWGRGTREVE